MREKIAVALAAVLVLVGLGFAVEQGVASGAPAAATPKPCWDKPHPPPWCVSPSPTPTETTPSPTPTEPSPTPTEPSPTPTTTPPSGFSCVLTGDVDCGPYAYDKIVNSNGYNTYTSTDCWGHPGCGYLLESNSPGDWQVTATEPNGETGVQTYPDVQQLMNNWNGAGWGNCNPCTDTPIGGLASLTSTYAETMNDTAGTNAQAAWDIWTSSGEVMVWVDTTPLRGSGGAATCGSGTLSGHPFTYYVYGGNPCSGGLPIIKLDSNLSSGTIDILEALHYFQSVGQVATSATIGQLNFGWEICSTGGVPETFRVSDYTIDGAPLTVSLTSAGKPIPIG